MSQGVKKLSTKEQKQQQMEQLGAQLLEQAGSFEKAQNKMLECIRNNQWESVFAYWSQGVMPKDSVPLHPVVRQRECVKVLQMWHECGGQLDDGAGVMLFHSALQNKVKNVQTLLGLLPQGNWERGAYLGVLNLISGHLWRADEKSWAIAKMCLPYVKKPEQEKIVQMAKKVSTVRGACGKPVHEVQKDDFYARLEKMVIEQRMEDPKETAVVEQSEPSTRVEAAQEGKGKLRL